MSKIEATVVADSINPQGDRLTSLLITFPRILLSEINTHRMLSKNTSSSRAIPFHKMVEAVENDPFIPIAWQKEHKGMQGTEYWTEKDEVRIDIGNEFEYIESIQPITEEFKIRWLEARDKAINVAVGMNDLELTKQLCNRLLEPFMWTTMLITGSKEGWDNFFNLRCPQYKIHQGTYKSKKEALKYGLSNGELKNWSDLDWLQNNEGQAEIHMMALAESIYDAVNESTPKQLSPNGWHIPFSNKIPFVGNLTESINEDNTYWKDYDEQNKVKISTAMAARTSYTIVGDEKEIDYEKMIGLHDRLIAQDPPHSSPMEHCCICVTDEDYNKSLKGEEKGWFRNYKGFKSYRQIIEESK